MKRSALGGLGVQLEVEVLFGFSLVLGAEQCALRVLQVGREL